MHITRPRESQRGRVPILQMRAVYEAFAARSRTIERGCTR
jgi:hypothetical protein